MTFQSILFKEKEDRLAEKSLQELDFFIDLNLDQIVAAITTGKEEYNLKPFFYNPLSRLSAIQYRQEIMQDLEKEDLFQNITTFAHKMRRMRQHFSLLEKLDYLYHREGWFLETVAIYCEAVSSLEQDVIQAEIHSPGFLSFKNYLSDYVNSDYFTTLVNETRKLKKELSQVRYCLQLKGLKVQVRKYAGESDYSTEIEKTFAKFKQQDAKDYSVELLPRTGMSHVEAQILRLVAKIYPELFKSLIDYYHKYQNFLDERIVLFDREVQFYISFLEFMSRFKKSGLSFCYPQITRKTKELYSKQSFDLALANKLLKENSTVICNDFFLKGQERIFVVTGPNQGGKTTFARTFGQLHYLSSLGCPIPGSSAKLFLFERIFTHFEKKEDIKELRGKLEDALMRIHSILEQATPNSIIIMNEIYSSTTIQDALFLAQRTMEKIIQLDILCVCVTFIDELASFSEKIVSMVAAVDPQDHTLRTYKIERRPADGRAYAISLAKKYQLTYDCLKERIKL